MAEDILSYLNYTQMMDDTRELLDSDKWNIKFITWPTVVYNPGEEFLHNRIKSVSGLNLSDFHTEPLKTKIRGFETHVQPNQTPLKNKEITWTLLDYEDQSIYVLMQDWIGKSCDPTTQRSYRAADLRGTFIYQRLNSVNLSVREWVHKGCMPSKVDYKDNFDSERKLVGDDVTIGMIGILFPPTLKNLSPV
jgi:hypothetical protein